MIAEEIKEHMILAPSSHLSHFDLHIIYLYAYPILLNRLQIYVLLFESFTRFISVTWAFHTFVE